MMLAAGTSTPTSITVVATNSPMSPEANRAMTRSLSGPRILPCTNPTLSPNRDARLSNRACASVRSMVSDSSTKGQIQYTSFPAFSARLTARRLFAEFRNVHVAEVGEHQRARNRGCTQHEHVDRFPLGGQRQALAH